MKLCRDLELDVVDVKDRQRRARESLEESKELIKSLKAENRQLKRCDRRVLQHAAAVSCTLTGRSAQGAGAPCRCN